jgi:hypothetical protein
MGKRPLFEISISVGTANSGVPMKTTRIVRPHSRKFEITKISFCPKLRTTPKNFISYSQRVEEVSGAALRTASLTFRLAKSIWSCRPGSSAVPSPSTLSPSSRQRTPIESRMYSASSRPPGCRTRPCRQPGRNQLRSPPTRPTTRGNSSMNCVRLTRRLMWRRIPTHRSLASDGRTTRHAGYASSQSIRRIKEAFGWIKTIAGQGPPSSAARNVSGGRLQPA